ncbi:MAG: class I SAM-dependent methyltransferase [Anaerolineales bacterium]|jgi:SAM-dependent methyltransferase
MAIEKPDDVVRYNQAAWEREVSAGNRWTIPVSSEAVAAARRGEFEILLTPTIPVPKDWFPHPLIGKEVLCLASGGGQQGPLMAAAGAHVTVFDNAPAQLDRDRMVAERENLEIRTVRGDMRDLSVFPDARFDLILHPVSNNFAPDIRPVWQEAYRVLCPGGALLSGFGNPVIYIFDWRVIDVEGRLEVRYPLPYTDLEHLPEEELARLLEAGQPLEFSHTLDDQIGGQIAAGFVIAGFYEDGSPPDEQDLINAYLPTFIATRAIKLAGFDSGGAT